MRSSVKPGSWGLKILLFGGIIGVNAVLSGVNENDAIFEL